ncbi:hypothetical protein EDD86DRAFT_11915 [Gorgonomyces haynaldii]|nr:hypothetical protein EDD86DRAFT_11915 [Gorgonomyces haynaldii]
MPAVASSIFKIRAHTDFISADSSLLSFRKGQPFYALSVDDEKGVYFVSTQFAVPFARNAVCGMVPKDYFDQVDLKAKDPPVERSRSVKAAPTQVVVPTRRQSLTHNPDCQNLIAEPVSFCHVQGSRTFNNVDMYKINVTRGQVSHLIYRDTAEFSQLHNHLLSLFPITSLRPFPNLEDGEPLQKERNLEHYLNHLLAISMKRNSTAEQILKLLNDLCTPRDSNELSVQALVRRDSGQSIGEERKKKNSFAKLSSIFGL